MAIRGFDIPVLFIVFNRPEVARRVFRVIKRIRPKILFVAADGPREGNVDDEIKCRIVRRIVEKIDWPCSVKRLYRKENLGCKKAVSGAINWFFRNVEEGIILEDDCLPNIAFFRFCEEMLQKYKNDNRVMFIGGNNFQNNTGVNNSYYFSKYTMSWGWASWRRAWKSYDIKMRLWPKTKRDRSIDYIFDSFLEKLYWYEIFEACYKNKIDTWDYQWLFNCWINEGLTIVPNVNLVENVGFGFRATHTKEKGNLSVKRGRLLFPLAHPLHIRRDIKKDLYDTRWTFNISWINLVNLKLNYKNSFIFTKMAEVLWLLNHRLEKKKGIGEAGKYNVEYLDEKAFNFEKRDIFDKNIYSFQSKSESPFIIDAGGYIGLATLYFKNKYPRAKILTFEPDPEAFNILRRNILVNKVTGIECINAALGNKIGESNFYSDGSDGGTVKKSVLNNGKTVGVVKLSEYINRRVDLLKMNIEGSEAEVFEDIKDKLGFVDQIIFEYHCFDILPQSLGKILTMLDNAGFRYVVSEATGAKAPTPLCLSKNYRFFNLVYAKKHK
jgi:FkbM family methyltransferase